MTRINYEMTGIRLVRSLFHHNPDYRPPAGGQSVQLRLAINNHGTVSPMGDLVNFTQSFQTGDGPGLPFTLEVEFEAVFSIGGLVPPGDYDHLIQRLLPQAVFPFTREYIAETTRRGGFPPLVLNPSFADVAEPGRVPVDPLQVN
jgi:preprotein translocase subunit SecB